MRNLALAMTATAVLLQGPCGVLADSVTWQRVAEAMGKPGSEMPGGVYRIGLPRTDLKVTLDGVQLKPTLALGSWLAFQQMVRRRP